MYGDRGDPTRAVSRLGEQLATADAGLLGVVQAVRTALRLPYVALVSDGKLLAGDGTEREPVVSWPLSYGGQPVGELRCGLRPGERQLSAADQQVLGLLSAPIAVAVHSTVLSADLQASREHLVGAREEERRRLRRELHDGVGPALTGIAFTADAAANLIESDQTRSRDLLTKLRQDTRAALADVRRLVDDLRPPALDELGLVGALQQRADQLAWRSDGQAVRVRLDVPAEVPSLPAAVEVATYRIATEALTNVVRHSRATTALIRLECGERLEVSVSDDGPPNGPWMPGVGLQAMRERAAELGGSFDAGPTSAGGRVRASFPLAAT
jgi:signal transduction histidine kinase